MDISKAFATSLRRSSPCGEPIKSSRKKPYDRQDSQRAVDSALSADNSFCKEILESWAVGTSVGKGGVGGNCAIVKTHKNNQNILYNCKNGNMASNNQRRMGARRDTGDPARNLSIIMEYKWKLSRAWDYMSDFAGLYAIDSYDTHVLYQRMPGDPWNNRAPGDENHTGILMPWHHLYLLPPRLRPCGERQYDGVILKNR